METINVWTVFLALITKSNGAVEYVTYVARDAEIPVEAVKKAKEHHEKEGIEIDTVACCCGRVSLAQHYSSLAVKRPFQAVSLRENENEYLLTTEPDFQNLVSYHGHMDLESMLAEFCLTDALNENVVSETGLREIISYFGDNGETPGGIKMSFLKDALLRPNMTWEQLKDAPDFVETAE